VTSSTEPPVPSGSADRALDLPRAAVLIGAKLLHDFNHLLMVVEVNLATAQKHVQHPPLAASLSAALRAARRGTRLTRHMAKLANGSTVDTGPVHLNALLRRAVRVARPILPRSVRLELRQAPGLWRARGDRLRLEALILDLILTLRDAMSHGGTIRLATANRSSSGDVVRLTLSALPATQVFGHPAPADPIDFGALTSLTRTADGHVLKIGRRGNRTLVTLSLPRHPPPANARRLP
jgi:hypothetical protein